MDAKLDAWASGPERPRDGHQRRRGHTRRNNRSVSKQTDWSSYVKWGHIARTTHRRRRTNQQRSCNTLQGWPTNINGGTTGGAAPDSDRAATDGGVACIPGTELDGGATGREGGATAGPNDTVWPDGPPLEVIRAPACLSTLMAQHVHRKERPSDRRTRYDSGSLHTIWTMPGSHLRSIRVRTDCPTWRYDDRAPGDLAASHDAFARRAASTEDTNDAGQNCGFKVEARYKRKSTLSSYPWLLEETAGF
jgi:hypothetical protein